MRWDYKEVGQEDLEKDETMLERLKTLGSDGWEVCWVYHSGTHLLKKLLPAKVPAAASPPPARTSAAPTKR